ncbi:MAG: zinc ribbon domain-containing protein [Promethearchaeota archaeon]
MHYKKNQYSEGFSICGLIFAGGFIFWGISTLLGGFRAFWDFSWIGFFFLGIGISILIGQIRAVTNREKLRNVVKYEFEQNPNTSIEEIIEKTKISRKDVQAIVLDLKARGALRGQFSGETGQLKPIPKQEQAPIQEKTTFCPNCGTPVSKDGAQYCSYCGATI